MTVSRSIEYQKPYVDRFINRYAEPAVGKCYCGCAVTLDNPMDNACTCGRHYNMSGQEVQANYGRAECARDGWAFDENDY
jgi:hypothetical protein